MEAELLSLLDIRKWRGGAALLSTCMEPVHVTRFKRFRKDDTAQGRVDSYSSFYNASDSGSDGIYQYMGFFLSHLHTSLP